MDKRFFIFTALAMGALLLNAYVNNLLDPPKPKPVAANAKLGDKAKPGDDAKPGDEAKPAQEPAAIGAAPNEIKRPEAALPPDDAKPLVDDKGQPLDPQLDEPERILSLGSADPKSPYRMLVTASNAGAAVRLIELNGERFKDLEDEAGYLGYLAPSTPKQGTGATVRVVGPGTPADLAGLKVGDVIVAVGADEVKAADDLRRLLNKTEPKQQVELTILRDEKRQKISVTLARQPLRVTQPEADDPASLLLTLHSIGKSELSRELGAITREADAGADGAQISELAPKGPADRAGLQMGDLIVAVDDHEISTPADLNELMRKVPAGMRMIFHVQRGGQQLKPIVALDTELPGLKLRTGNWQVRAADEEQITFVWELPLASLEIVKQIRLAKVDPQAPKESAGKEYHLAVDVKIVNKGNEPQSVAYMLDGPTGLPIEGWWYANKIGREWGAVGVRDAAVHFANQSPRLIPCLELVGDEEWPSWREEGLQYIGVDAQYFSSALIPQRKRPDDEWLAESTPLRVGLVPEDKARRKLTDVSCRVISKPVELAPGASLEHQYLLFAGPKQRELLAKYGLGELLYYGWPIWAVVAEFMLDVLHFFYSLVGNYGLAIVMLTVTVRLCMFPLSRKQAISAQKMQELQPEIKKLGEKYKTNMEARNKAQQELFRKHNYNPLGGCLLMFVQLPIFVGLYRSLMIDVELRQASLFPGWHWCANLAAPDMLFRWKNFLPDFLTDETGYLGPYFNLLPLFTIALFIVQQKMFMPPPADEQAAMQQKMMKYMMVVMGFFFFKVASGLCLYFIASSLWGIAERKLLPKLIGKGAAATPAATAPAPAPAISANGNGASTKQRKKQRGGK